MTSKNELCYQFKIGRTTVRETLTACGLSTRQRVYGPDEVRRFELARTLLREGLTYQQVSQRLGTKERATATAFD